MIARDIWIEIIKDFQEKELPKIVDREIEVDLNIPLRRATTLIGPRRAGKTFYFFQLIQKLLSKGVNKNRILYINLEELKLEGATVKDLLNCIEIYYEMFPENKNETIWLFLDEIQNVEDWERFVRTMLDREKIKVFITGSSSKILSKEIATQLRGRSITYNIYPFSFREYLRAKNIQYSKYLSSSDIARISNALDEYLHAGGYPEAVLYPRERDKILRDIVDVTIYRDIIERWNIRNIKVLRLLIKALINSKEFSVNKFYRYLQTLGIKIGKNTIYDYLEYLQDALFIFLLRRYSPSYRLQKQTIPKVYVIDNGILTSYGVKDKTRLIENLVFLELIRRKSYGLLDGELYYYKTNSYEVDFLVKTSNGIELIQVAYDVSDFNTKNREIRALVKASDQLNTNKLMIINWDYDGIESHSGKEIKFIKLWKWLLSTS